MRGRLLAIEGLDGSGKATQARLLCDRLRRGGVGLRRVSFPNYAEESSAPVRMYLGGLFGGDPGDVNAYAASSFFAVDRFASYVRHWRADYRNGALIVADRYTTSNLIYQLPKLPRGEWDGFAAWLQDYEYEKLGLPRPDLTIYLDLAPALAGHLLDKRYGGDREKRDIHESDAGYQAACRESAAYAAKLLSWRTVACASGGKLRAPADIHAEMTKIVLEEFHLYASV